VVATTARVAPATARAMHWVVATTATAVNPAC
jgi:hypothetical protein